MGHRTEHCFFTRNYPKYQFGKNLYKKSSDSSCQTQHVQETLCLTYSTLNTDTKAMFILFNKYIKITISGITRVYIYCCSSSSFNLILAQVSSVQIVQGKV